MFPLLLALGKRMPIVGDFLSMFDEAASKKSRPPRREGPARSRYPAQGEPIPRKRYGNYDPDF